MSWLARLLAILTLGLTACSALPRPAAAPTMTPVPEPPQITSLARGVQIDGHGNAQTEDITPDYTGGLAIGIELATLSHDGHSTFIVVATDSMSGKSETLTSAIGVYTGQRPLVVEGPINFQVTADGNWSIKIGQLPSGGSSAFKGSGDSVSGYFDPPTSAAPFTVTHDGKSTFFVNVNCVGGTLNVFNTTGPVNNTATITFPRGPCFWEVRADGNFSIQPQ